MLFSRNSSCGFLFFFQGCDHPKTCGYTKPPHRAQQKSWLVRGIIQGHGGAKVGMAHGTITKVLSGGKAHWLRLHDPFNSYALRNRVVFFFRDRYGGSSARARPSNPAQMDLRILVPCLHLLIILLTLMLWLLWPVLWLVPGQHGDAGVEGCGNHWNELMNPKDVVVGTSFANCIHSGFARSVVQNKGIRASTRYHQVDVCPLEGDVFFYPTLGRICGIGSCPGLLCADDALVFLFLFLALLGFPPVLFPRKAW